MTHFEQECYFDEKIPTEFIIVKQYQGLRQKSIALNCVFLKENIVSIAMC